MHFYPEIQQLKAWLDAAVCNTRHVDLILVRHDEDAIALFVSDEGIEGDGSLCLLLCLFLSQEEATTISRGRSEGEITGRADGGKLGLEGNAFFFLFVSAAAFACKSQTNHCKQEGTDNCVSQYLSHPYGSWFLHS